MNTDTLVELEEFFTDIEPELPRCPTPVIENRIRDSIIESCERANIWRWQHPGILMIDGVRDYELMTPTSDTLIHTILGVCVDGNSVTNDYSGYTYHTSVSGDVSVPDRGSIQLRHAPRVRGGPSYLQPLVSIKPSRKTLEVSGVLLNDYYQLIVTGTLAKALMMDKRPWSNPDMARDKERKYEYLIAKARQAVDRGFKTGTQKFAPRKFA